MKSCVRASISGASLICILDFATLRIRRSSMRYTICTIARAASTIARTAPSWVDSSTHDISIHTHTLVESRHTYLRTLLALECFMERVQIPQCARRSPERWRVGIRPDPRHCSGRSSELCPNPSVGQEEELFIGVLQSGKSQLVFEFG
jgi:hypothetical protein